MFRKRTVLYLYVLVMLANAIMRLLNKPLGQYDVVFAIFYVLLAVGGLYFANRKDEEKN